MDSRGRADNLRSYDVSDIVGCLDLFCVYFFDSDIVILFVFYFRKVVCEHRDETTNVNHVAQQKNTKLSVITFTGYFFMSYIYIYVYGMF